MQTPSLWHWWMAAFTCLSPLHISLPVCLMAYIPTCWLVIPYSLPSSSNSIRSSLALYTKTFILPPPFYALLSHFLCLRATQMQDSLALVSIFILYSTRRALSTLSMTKRTMQQKGNSIKRMSGLTVRGSCKRRLCGRAFASRLECVCVSAPYNYECVGSLFWYACGCFGMLALT